MMCHQNVRYKLTVSVGVEVIFIWDIFQDACVNTSQAYSVTLNVLQLVIINSDSKFRVTSHLENQGIA